jgi:hypothetical protein
MVLYIHVFLTSESLEEQGAEENIWTKERWSDRRVEVSA